MGKIAILAGIATQCDRAGAITAAPAGALATGVGGQSRRQYVCIGWTTSPTRVTIGSMSEQDAVPLPRQGAVFFDVRGAARSLRLSWYADSRVAVFSVWQADRCTGTFRLPFSDLARMIETLQTGPLPGAAYPGSPSDPAAGYPERTGYQAAYPDVLGYPPSSGHPAGDAQSGYTDIPDYDPSYGAPPGNTDRPGTDRPGYPDRPADSHLAGEREAPGYGNAPGYPDAPGYGNPYPAADPLGSSPGYRDAPDYGSSPDYGDVPGYADRRGLADVPGYALQNGHLRYGDAGSYPSDRNGLASSGERHRDEPAGRGQLASAGSYGEWMAAPTMSAAPVDRPDPNDAESVTDTGVLNFPSVPAWNGRPEARR